MAIKLGNFAISKAFIGNTSVAKMYLGNTLVFPIKEDIIDISDVIISHENITLYEGQLGLLSAYYEPATVNVPEEDRYFIWTSSNPLVVSIDYTPQTSSDCNIKGLSIGNSIITVSSKNGKTDLCTVTVREKNNDGFIIIEEPVIDMSETNFSYEGDYWYVTINNYGKVIYRTYNEDNVTYVDNDVQGAASLTFIVTGGTFKVETDRYGHTKISCSAKSSTDTSISYGTVQLERKVSYEGKLFTFKSNIINIQQEGYVAKTTTYLAAYYDITNPNEIQEIIEHDSASSTEPSYTYTRKEISGYTYKGYCYGTSIEECKNATSVDNTNITCSSLSPTRPCVVFFYTKNSTSIPVTSISIYPSGVSLAVGQSATLSITYSPSNANTGTNVTWSSSDNSICSVNSGGLISALKAGSCTITAITASGLSSTCSINISAPVTTYKVSFNANGGTGTMSAKTCTQGSSITLPYCTFTNTGKEFIGWSTDSKDASTLYKPGDTFTPTGNITLYALWNQVSTTYSVYFFANGGTGNQMATVIASADNPITLPASSYTYSGKQFGGWALNTAGTGTIYLAGSSYTATGHTNFYAVWLEPNISSISLSSSSLTLRVGYPQSGLTVTYIPSNAAGKLVAWSSNDTTVAYPFSTTNTGCSIYPQKVGTAIITATTPNGKTASCEVTVTA